MQTVHTISFWVAHVELRSKEGKREVTARNCRARAEQSKRNSWCAVFLQFWWWV